MPLLFGEKLRFLRHKHGLTQSDLAQQLDLASHAHIAKLEANQDVPSLALVIRAADLLHINTDYLLRDTIPVQDVQIADRDQGVGTERRVMSFGAKLRALRYDRNLTQAELAKQLGLARQGYLSNLETGRKMPSLDLVVQIADLFGVTTEYILEDMM